MGDRRGGEASNNYQRHGTSVGDGGTDRPTYTYGHPMFTGSSEGVPVQASGQQDAHRQGQAATGEPTARSQPSYTSTFGFAEPVYHRSTYDTISGPSSSTHGSLQEPQLPNTTTAYRSGTASLASSAQPLSEAAPADTRTTVDNSSNYYPPYRPLSSQTLVSPQPQPIERSNSSLSSNLAYAVDNDSSASLQGTSSAPYQPLWQEHSARQPASTASEFAVLSRDVLPAYPPPPAMSISSMGSYSHAGTPYQQDTTSLPGEIVPDQRSSSWPHSRQTSGSLGTAPYSQTHSHSSASISDQSPLQSPFATHFPQDSTGTSNYYAMPPARPYLQQYGNYSSYPPHTYSAFHPQDRQSRSNTHSYASSLPAVASQQQGNSESTANVSQYHGYYAPIANAMAHTQAEETDMSSDKQSVGYHFHVPLQTASASAPRQAEYYQSPSSFGTSASLPKQSDTPHQYYPSFTPKYPLHQFQGRPQALPLNTDTSNYPQPSPTWTDSPLVSPALMPYPPGFQYALPSNTDYFGTASPLPSPVDHFKQSQLQHTASNPSSPPTSNSPASQQSGQVNEAFMQTASPADLNQPSDNVVIPKAGRAASRPKSKGNSKTSGTTAPYVKKETRIVNGACEACSKVFATINIRGHPKDFENEYDLIYYCLDCAPASLGVPKAALEASVRLPSAVTAEEVADRPRASIVSGNTVFEAAVGSADSIKLTPRGVKKRIRATDVSSPTICDVCARWVAHGAPVAREVGAELAFNVEIVCTFCSEKYRRCSDCGGGGGARLGVGKWRCKELFSPGRKTCDLSHARQSSIIGMEYVITRVSDIPKDEMPELVKKCRAVFEAALYSSLAVPEVLERGTAMASTYEDVVAKILDGWQEAKRVIEEDVEARENYRRYVGLRWSEPKPRKVVSRKKGSKGDDSDSTDEVTGTTGLSKILRPSMNLSGYVSGEWDIRGGTFYITVSVPYSTGEQYEGSAHLIGLLQERIIQERQDMINALVQQGRHAEAMSIPPILHSFTMLFYSPESKLMSYMESKRQLIPLQRYIAKYPDTDPRVFPPYRKAYIGTAQKPEHWTVLVRRIQNPMSTFKPSSS